MSGPQPQQPYGQPGAGPSNYYPPMPMHYGYPNPQNPYGYPYIPGPTPMDQPPPPAPHSPRLNGASRGGFHPRGGAPAFQPYPQHAHHVPPQHYMHPPPPHQHQLHPHPHAGRISPLAYGPPQKYPGPPQAHPTPYSPHHYPIQSAPYSPVWTPQHQHPQQPLSPLPKQLSMLPTVSSPRISSPRSPRIPLERPAQPSLAVPPSESAPSLPTEPSTPPSQDVIAETTSVGKQPELEAEVGSQSHLVSDHPDVELQSDPQSQPVPKLSPAPSSRAEMKASSPLAFSAPLGPQDQHSSSTSPAAFSSPPASPAPLTSTALSFGSTIDVGGWAIWSRRPTNPSSAPGIIISPRARPPPHVVSGALEVRTPPGSPKVLQTDESHALDGSPTAMKESPHSNDLPPSSSATETETTPASSLAANTPTAGSPASTNTSVSLAHAHAPANPSKDGALTAQATAAVAPAVFEGPSTSSSTPAAPEAAPSDSMPPSASVPAVRKSWASLLRPSGSGSATPKAGNALPTSSVIGFSIPAENIGSAVSSPSATGPYSSANALPPALVSLLTSGPPSQAGAMRIRPRGLINTGNMCFANAVLQVLIYCPPFHTLFTQLGKVLPGPVVGSQKETMSSKATPLVDATISFLKEFIPTADKEGRQKDSSRERGRDQERKRAGKNREVSAGDDEEWGLDSFIPTGIYDAMKEKKRFGAMGGGHQEDAEEFLGFYLDTLEEELLSILSPAAPNAQVSKPAVEDQDGKPATQEDGWLEVGKRNRSVVTRTAKSTESPITRIFGGKFRSTLRTPHQKDSVVVEDWRALQLDIQREQVHTIKDAVQCISLPQPVQITMPTRPGHVIDATQHVLIDALPSILVLHMKRFLYDTKVGDVVKVGKKVAFEPELLIPADVMAPARKTGPQARYKLFGVLYHHGQSASGGHYTLDVLHPNRDLSTKPREAWIRIDDELVSDVRPEDVFGGLERDDRCAYLLFYRKVGGGPRT